MSYNRNDFTTTNSVSDVRIVIDNNTDNSNNVQKTGDIMTGDLMFMGSSKIIFADGKYRDRY